MNTEPWRVAARSFTAKTECREEANRDTWLPSGSPECGFSCSCTMHIQARGDLFPEAVSSSGFVLSTRRGGHEGEMGGVFLFCFQ